VKVYYLPNILKCMEKHELKDVPIDKVIPYKKNPRFNEQAVKGVAESIKSYGYIKTSIGVDEDMVLLYGHTTLKALQLLKMEKIPEISQILGLTPGQKIGYRIADNRTGETATWDYALLVENLDMLQDLGDSLEPTGFGIDDIDLIMKKTTKEYNFSDLDAEVDALDPVEDAEIKIVVPKKFEASVRQWLSFGMGNTAPQLGQGVMKRCGLL
jgi:ParB-like chromosome segregation protein Spo0J